MQQPALIIMAAGLGSRFGGLKQIEPVGDRGEIIAAVSAAIATVLGESVGGIRIVSFKKVD